MSIKRISRRRVAAPIQEYIDEEPLAIRVNTSVDVGPNDTRTGGDVDKNAPRVNRNAPTISKNAPTINKNAPTFNKNAPTYNRSSV